MVELVKSFDLSAVPLADVSTFISVIRQFEVAIKPFISLSNLNLELDCIFDVLSSLFDLLFRLHTLLYWSSFTSWLQALYIEGAVDCSLRNHSMDRRIGLPIHRSGLLVSCAAARS